MQKHIVFPNSWPSTLITSTAMKIRHQTKGLVRRIDWILDTHPDCCFHFCSDSLGSCSPFQKLFFIWFLKVCYWCNNCLRLVLSSGLPLIFWFTNYFPSHAFIAVLRHIVSICILHIKKANLRETQWCTQGHGWKINIVRKKSKSLNMEYLAFLFFFLVFSWPVVLELLPKQSQCHSLCWTDPAPLLCLY